MMNYEVIRVSSDEFVPDESPLEFNISKIYFPMAWQFFNDLWVLIDHFCAVLP